MPDSFIGEIRAFAFSRPPSGWLRCDGQSLQISQYGGLYILIGTTYGGDGQQTFNLPDLRGRAPISQGQGPGLPRYEVGDASGEETHTLTTVEMGRHSHALTSSTVPGTTTTPGQSVHLAAANPTTTLLYAAPANIQSYDTMAPASVSAAGGNTAHNNMMPSLVLNYCIAVEGIVPSA